MDLELGAIDAAVEGAVEADDDAGRSISIRSPKHKPSVMGTNEAQSNETLLSSEYGKENQNYQKDYHIERFCFECKRSLAKSRHLINISGQLHRWHPECFKCNICDHSLDKETSCHIYKDKIVCREDYAKLQRNNSVKCTRCRWPIAASDWIRRADEYVYHLACFSCDICSRQLNTGEQFTITVQEKTVRLLCRLHFAIETSQQPTVSELAGPMSSFAGHLDEHSQSSPRSTRSELNCQSRQICSSVINHKFTPVAQFESAHYFRMLATGSSSASSTPAQASSDGKSDLGEPADLVQGQEAAEAIGHLQHHQHQHQHQHQHHHLQHPHSHTHQQHQQHQQHQNPSSAATLRAGGASTSSSSNSSNGLAGSKSKRVRTTFTEDQLTILQTHFQIDSNPDGQDLERIASRTGLSKRVTQVWFQNSRARQKKYLIKRKPGSSTASLVSSSGNNNNNNNNNPVQCGLSSMAAAGGSHQFGSQHRDQQQSTGCFGLSDEQQKWPTNLSDRSDLSLDAQASLDDSSSDNQLIVSEDCDD